MFVENEQVGVTVALDVGRSAVPSFVPRDVEDAQLFKVRVVFRNDICLLSTSDQITIKIPGRIG